MRNWAYQEGTRCPPFFSEDFLITIYRTPRSAREVQDLDYLQIQYFFLSDPIVFRISEPFSYDGISVSWQMQRGFLSEINPAPCGFFLKTKISGVRLHQTKPVRRPVVLFSLILPRLTHALKNFWIASLTKILGLPQTFCVPSESSSHCYNRFIQFILELGIFTAAKRFWSYQR